LEHTPETLRRAAAVWQGMKQLYGQSFVTIYGQSPGYLWVNAIAGLTDQQCRVGLNQLTKEKRSFPANLTEFVDACRPGAGSPRFLGVPETAAQRQKRLAKPRPRREHIDACLARMRSSLGRASE
jgi:hypothetical protein